MRWKPDTCKCEMDVPRPSVNGKFIKRCKIHQSPATTTDVYAHNIQPNFRFKGNLALQRRAIRRNNLGIDPLPAPEQAIIDELDALKVDKAAEKVTT